MTTTTPESMSSGGLEKMQTHRAIETGVSGGSVSLSVSTSLSTRPPTIQLNRQPLSEIYLEELGKDRIWDQEGMGFVDVTVHTVLNGRLEYEDIGYYTRQCYHEFSDQTRIYPDGGHPWFWETHKHLALIRCFEIWKTLTGSKVQTGLGLSEDLKNSLGGLIGSLGTLGGVQKDSNGKWSYVSLPQKSVYKRFHPLSPVAISLCQKAALSFAQKKMHIKQDG